jgi:HEAT repeat protein
VAEAFDKVPWASLEHAYGPASDLPDYFRGLLSPASEVREWAVDELSEVLVHQGTASEATVRAVPILFELLERPGVRGRADIATLLAAIAEAEPGELPDPVADQCRRAVGERLDALLPFLRHRDPGVRAAVAAAAGRFPERAGGLVPLLRAALARERSEAVRLSLEYAIGRLTGHSARP